MRSSHNLIMPAEDAGQRSPELLYLYRGNGILEIYDLSGE
jgi:hypothetical protein